VTDADRDEAVIVAQPATRGTYGEFSIDTAGRWRYVLDNASPAVQALGTADIRTETFAVTSRDGTATSVVITVQGLDEPVAPAEPLPPVEPPPVTVVPPQPAAPTPEPAPLAPEPVAPPALVAAPFDSAVTSPANVAADVTASPITVAMQRMSDPAQAFHTFTFNDLYTSSSGFQVVVIEAPQPRLSLYRGVSDQYADAGTSSSFAVPYDAFAHSDPSERILLSAGLANGQGLPSWVRFDPQSGKFEFQAPAGYHGDLTVKVVARDTQGREATLLFRFTVGDRTAAERGGRAGLSEQLRQAGQRSVQALERATDAAKPAGRPAVRQAE
jgi:VCBS repeat-containing protein